MSGYQVKVDALREGETLDPFKTRVRVKESELKEKKEAISERYRALSVKREPFLTRAKAYAKMTLPALFNENEAPGSDGGAMQQSWQSLGAQGVNHLSNKLTMTWFPPQRSFFRMTFTDDAKKALYEAGVKDADLLSLLSKSEEKARMEHELVQGRIAWGLGAKHLIAAGNVLLYQPEDGATVAYPLDRYVIRRSKSGRVMEFIIEETKELAEFPPNIQALLKAKSRDLKPISEVKVYTSVKWTGRQWLVEQEALNIKLAEDQKLAEDNLPYIPLVWDRMYGEAYGRGLVEQNYGDIFTYGFLARAQAKGVALMSEVKFLVRRGSATSPREHAKAETGDYLWGEEGDISVIQLEKYNDLQAVSQVMEVYAKRIGQIFLLASANRRDAERVTAFELRQDAQELETALGGTYSQVAVAGQIPYARILLRRIKFKLAAKDVVPIITTGIDALGKAGELDKLMQFSEMMGVPNSWSESAQGRIRWADFMKFIAANLGMDTDAWLMTEQEYQQIMQQQQAAQQQQQAMELAAKLGPSAMKGE